MVLLTSIPIPSILAITVERLDTPLQTLPAHRGASHCELANMRQPYGGFGMTTSAPKTLTIIVSAVLVLVGIFASLVIIPAVTPYAIWIVVIGYVALLAGTLIDGM